MNTWILIADAGEARLFELEKNSQLELIRHFMNPKGRAKDQDLVSDGRGRLDKGLGRNVMSAMEPRTTPHEAEMDRFALELTNFLDKAAEEKKFGFLAMIAPPHFLGLLRQRLNAVVAKMVVLALDKNLVHLNERNLQDHLAPVIAEIEKAARNSQASA